MSTNVEKKHKIEKIRNYIIEHICELYSLYPLTTQPPIVLTGDRASTSYKDKTVKYIIQQRLCETSTSEYVVDFVNRFATVRKLFVSETRDGEISLPMCTLLDILSTSSYVLRLDSLNTMSEILVPYAPGTNSYSKSMLTKCSRILVDLMALTSETNLYKIQSVLEKLTNITQDTNSTNKMLVKVSNYSKLHSTMRGKIKRQLDILVVDYVTKRMTYIPEETETRLAYPTTNSTPVPINLARNVAIHNLCYYRVFQLPLHTLISICLAENRILVTGLSELRHSHSLAELTLRDDMISATCARIKRKLIVMNVQGGCTCTTMCRGWAIDHGESDVGLILDSVIKKAKSIKVCNRCGHSVDVRNKKCSRSQLRIEITNVKCTSCSLDGCPSFTDSQLYFDSLDETNGTYQYIHKFHFTDVVNLVESTQNKGYSSGPEMRFTGQCFGGNRLCRNEVRGVIKTSTKLNQMFTHVTDRNKKFGKMISVAILTPDKVDEINYVHQTTTEKGDKSKVKKRVHYHFADMSSFMCSDCSREKASYMIFSDMPIGLETNPTSNQGSLEETASEHPNVVHSILLPETTRGCCKKKLCASTKTKTSAEGSTDTDYCKLKEQQQNYVKFTRRVNSGKITINKYQRPTQQSCDTGDDEKQLNFYYQTKSKLLGRDPRDKMTCIAKMVHFIEQIHTKSVSNDRQSGVECVSIASLLKPYMCRSCKIKLMCPHVTIRYRQFLETYARLPEETKQRISVTHSRQVIIYLVAQNIVQNFIN